MKTVEVRWTHRPGHEQTVGTLVEQDRRVLFEYHVDFLTSQCEISPFHLPLRSGLQEHRDRDFGPLPGVFDDSLPDGWGRLLMDRFFRQQGRNPAEMTALDRLLWLGRSTMGALTYHPSRDTEEHSAILDLAEVSARSKNILMGESAEILPELMRAGGSPGGARPKVLVGLRDQAALTGEADLPPGYCHWLVKFAATDERVAGVAHQAGRVEYAYAQMAKAAGLKMPKVRLFELHGQPAAFGVERFDRIADTPTTDNQRIHMHTLANLLHADFRLPALDYQELLKVTQVLTRHHEYVLDAYRLMVFNIASHNRDDHSKNFAFILDRQGNWALAPAYDLTFSEGPGGEHSMSIAGEGRCPVRSHCLALAKGASIKANVAQQIIEQVNQAIAQWPQFAGDAGCDRQLINTIGRMHSRL